MNRRPLATRGKPWAKRLAQTLVAIGASPNAISTASVLFAVVAAIAFLFSGSTTGLARMVLLIVAAAGIQLRLLCNMLDGMVAVEGGKRTAFGDLFNDVPDRIADVAIVLGAGYGINHLPLGAVLGWAAALAAVTNAYIRLLGGAIGATQYFVGPMAKPHRMATLTVAAIVSIFDPLWNGGGQVIEAALALIVAGAIIGSVRRLVLVGAEIARR